MPACQRAEAARGPARARWSSTVSSRWTSIRPAATSISPASRPSFKYQGYLKRQEDSVERQRRQEGRGIPAEFGFDGIPGLSREMVERLSTVRPGTLGQASRIPGVTPAAVAVIAAYLDRARAGAALQFDSLHWCVRSDVRSRLVRRAAKANIFHRRPLADQLDRLLRAALALEPQDQPHVAR